MSDTCRLFPPFGDPWPSCLLPSHLVATSLRLANQSALLPGHNNRSRGPSRTTENPWGGGDEHEFYEGETLPIPNLVSIKKLGVPGTHS